MPLTVEQFTQRLTSSGIMSADDLRDRIAAVPVEQRPSDGEALALIELSAAAGNLSNDRSMEL